MKFVNWFAAHPFSCGAGAALALWLYSWEDISGWIALLSLTISYGIIYLIEE